MYTGAFIFPGAFQVHTNVKSWSELWKLKLKGRGECTFNKQVKLRLTKQAKYVTDHCHYFIVHLSFSLVVIKHKHNWQVISRLNCISSASPRAPPEHFNFPHCSLFVSKSRTWTRAYFILFLFICIDGRYEPPWNKIHELYTDKLRRSVCAPENLWKLDCLFITPDFSLPTLDYTIV